MATSIGRLDLRLQRPCWESNQSTSITTLHEIPGWKWTSLFKVDGSKLDLSKPSLGLYFNVQCTPLAWFIFVVGQSPWHFRYKIMACLLCAFHEYSCYKEGKAITYFKNPVWAIRELPTSSTEFPNCIEEVAKWVLLCAEQQLPLRWLWGWSQSWMYTHVLSALFTWGH